MSERDLSNAYLRLRALIPGAYDTPHAPRPEQVWATTEAALRRLLQERDEAMRQAKMYLDTGRKLLEERDEARIRHPITGDTWVVAGDTGRVREVVTDDVERAREEGVRILAEAADEFVAAQRLAPYPRVPDAFTHERIAAALVATARDERERAQTEIEDWRGRLATQCGETLAARYERDQQREACARHVEALAIAIRDNGPTTAEGLLTALAGAQVGALLDAAASLRGGP